MKKTYSNKIISVGLSLFIILFFSCDTVPAKYEISIGCGGGFTSTYHSYRVLQDGTVYYAVQSYVDPGGIMEGTVIGKISQEDVKQFYLRLAAIGFNDMDHVSPDNLSYSVSLTEDDVRHSVTWPMESDDGSLSNVIKQVAVIFKDIDKLVSPLRPKKG